MNIKYMYKRFTSTCPIVTVVDFRQKNTFEFLSLVRRYIFFYNMNSIETTRVKHKYNFYVTIFIINKFELSKN